MNNFFTVLTLLSIASLFSCNSNSENKIVKENKKETVLSIEKQQPKDQNFKIDIDALTKDYMTWYTYTYYNVRLSEDFIGLDLDSTKIDKTSFLNKLNNGKLAAYKIKILNGQPVFKLYKLNSKDERIIATIKQLASAEMEYYKMEGHEIPKYNFKDLNNQTYSNTSTKGKILVLKCWFIRCVACVKEFPELNTLVTENKDRKDILFVSLAMDTKEELVNFLKTKEFKYEVIPNTKSFMLDEMHITGFPTHLLINTEGKIIKVTERIEDLIPYLDKEKAKELKVKNV